MLQSQKLSFRAKSLPWGLTATCDSPPMELSWAQTNFKARCRFCAWIRTLKSQKNTQMKDCTHLARGPSSGRKQWGCPQGHWGPSLGIVQNQFLLPHYSDPECGLHLAAGITCRYLETIQMNDIRIIGSKLADWAWAKRENTLSEFY